MFRTLRFILRRYLNDKGWELMLCVKGYVLKVMCLPRPHGVKSYVLELSIS
jgi:hypothetical protein